MRGTLFAVLILSSVCPDAFRPLPPELHRVRRRKHRTPVHHRELVPCPGTSSSYLSMRRATKPRLVSLLAGFATTSIRSTASVSWPALASFPTMLRSPDVNPRSKLADQPSSFAMWARFDSLFEAESGRRLTRMRPIRRARSSVAFRDGSLPARGLTQTATAESRRLPPCSIVSFPPRCHRLQTVPLVVPRGTDVQVPMCDPDQW